MNTNRLIVGVAFGGKSTEHEVSVITGLQVIENIDREKYDVMPIYISKSGCWFIGDEMLNSIETYRDLKTIEEKLKTSYLLPDPNSKNALTTNKIFGQQLKKPDVVFLSFHGGCGENGAFQGFLDMAEIPYTGSGVTGSAVGFDKIIMKDIFKSNHLPITNYIWFYRQEFEQNRTRVLSKIESSLKYPLFVKPANAGSSIGVQKTHNQKELINAIEVAAFYDRKVIVEESFEDAKEINISVIGNSGKELQCSVCEQVVSSGEVLSYDDKYKGPASAKATAGKGGMASAKRIIPAPLKAETVHKLQETAKKAYEALDLMGLARIDFMVRQDESDFVILEPNTIPGSMSFYLWEASGLKFKDMITKLIELAISRKEDDQKTVKSFESNILQNFKSGGLKS